MKLPAALESACKPLFDVLPIEKAMRRLTDSNPIFVELLHDILDDPAMRGRDDLAAALYLYTDDLESSHSCSQSMETDTGSFWHGIMHRREGDFGNSRYWFRRASSHPLIAGPPYLDPVGLVDAVSKASSDDITLVERQRTEWSVLFEWCANQN